MDIGLNDQTSNRSFTNYINKFTFHFLSGTDSSGEIGFIQFVATCLFISLGLPLTLSAIYSLYSQVRNGEVAPIYVINLLISDLIQFCCMITEVAQPRGWILEFWKIFYIFSYIYEYSLLTSVSFMVCIALERYLVIVHPLWYRCKRTIKTSVLICVLVWILLFVCVLTEYFIDDKNIFLVIFNVFFLLPLPLLTFFMIATLKALSASISIPTDEKRRIAGMLILVLLIYLLLFLPAIILNLYLYILSYIPHLHLLFVLTPMFLKLSPLADLVLYILMRKGTIQQISAFVCRCRNGSNEISAVTMNYVKKSVVKDGERERERTEEV